MSSSLSLDELVALNRNRWMVALLAELAARRGARFAELLHRLDLPRDSLVRTIEAARAAGWVQPNPGYGHPLRPEYLLTDQGARIAAAASAIRDAQTHIGLGPGVLTRWSLPLVRSIHRGHDRFNGLARVLAPASPRALSQGLRSLSDKGLVRRDLIDTYPPTSRYALTTGGVLLARAT